MKIKLIAGIKGVYLGYLFGEDAEITIGREIGNTIAPIIDNLSRHHAKIYFKDGDWYAEDCGSTNGSYVNGKKLEAAQKLVTNDMLRCGLIDIQIELMNEQDAAVPAPVAAEPPPPQATIVAPVPAALKSAPAAPLSPVTPIKPAASDPEMTPVDDIPELSPEELSEPTPEPAPAAAPAPAAEPALQPAPAAAPASPLTPAKPVIRKPTVGGGLKAGIKLPPKPGLAAGGLKLPPKPGIAGGLKLPPKPGAAAGGLKPGLKLPPKQGLAAGLKLPPKSGV